jgi:DnaJ-class molecular chaperone
MKKTECEECEGTGKRSFYECDDLVDCVDCNGTGKQTLASESQGIAGETADETSGRSAYNSSIRSHSPD